MTLKPAANESALALVPAGARARLWLLSLTLLLPAVLAGVALVASGNQPWEAVDRAIADPQGPLLLAGFLVVLWFALDRLMQRHRLRLEVDGLEVTTSFYRQRYTFAQLQLADARVVDLDERPELAPLLKSNGFVLPGFSSGWFRSRKFGKQFVARAGGKRVLWLPTTKGHALLLQPRNPQALLQRLRELAGNAQVTDPLRSR